MTGYGRAKKTLSNRDITVEVRSVNNRYLDCTVKLPRAYIFAEDAIKGRVQKAISRGKVDVFVTIDSTGADEEVVVVNEGLARSYLEALRKLYEIDGGNYLQKQSYAADLARIPDVLTVTKAEEDLESVGADICEVLDEALASYNQMRATEGKKLAEDIGGRLTTIETLTGKVEERSPETVREYREKLTARMDELGLKKEDYQFYLDLRKYGSARHSGFGLGFERCVMYLTGMGNIRDVIPFPRTVGNCEL